VGKTTAEGLALTLQTTAVTTHSYFGATGVRVVIPAVPGITSALKEKGTVTKTLTAAETCGVGLITAMAKALMILMTAV